MNLNRLKDKIKKGKLSLNALNVSQGIGFFLFLCAEEAEEADSSSFFCFTCTPGCATSCAKAACSQGGGGTIASKCAQSCTATSCAISCAQGTSVL